LPFLEQNFVLRPASETYCHLCTTVQDALGKQFVQMCLLHYPVFFRAFL
jgi:hypothetical protein